MFYVNIFYNKICLIEWSKIDNEKWIDRLDLELMQKVYKLHGTISILTT